MHILDVSKAQLGGAHAEKLIVADELAAMPSKLYIIESRTRRFSQLKKFAPSQNSFLHSPAINTSVRFYPGFEMPLIGTSAE